MRHSLLKGYGTKFDSAKEGMMRGVKVSLLVSLFCGMVYGQWEADKRLTVYPSSNDYGSWNNARTIAMWNTMVHIVWEHRLGNNPGELYYIRSSNSGSSFDPDQQLTTQNSHYPSIAVRDSIVHVVWKDYRDGNGEIYYKRSEDDGMLWWADERLTNASGTSWYASVACWDCPYDVHVAWTDKRDGNQEIYYKRHKCEPPGIEESKELKVRSPVVRVFSLVSLGSARFSIYLPHSSLVEVKVFDVSGRLLDRQEFEWSSGRHEFSWHNENHGSYFFRFRIEGFEIFEKAIIF